jgi:hypothetical protein
MNPVAVPIVPNLAAKPATVTRGQTSREQQAAFSPALMLLLAPGLVAASPPTVPAPTADAPFAPTVVGTPSPAPPAVATAPPIAGAAVPTPEPTAMIGAPRASTGSMRSGAGAGEAAPPDPTASAAQGLPVAMSAPDRSAAPHIAPAHIPAVADRASSSAPVSGSTRVDHAVPVATNAPASGVSAAAAPTAAMARLAAPSLVAMQELRSEPVLDRSTQGSRLEPTASVIDFARRSSGTARARARTETDTRGPRQAASRGTRSAPTRPQSTSSNAATTPAAETARASAARDASGSLARAGGDAAAPGAAPAAPEDPRLAAIDPARTRVTSADQITLRVEDAQGAEARLRVAVRGRDVRATIVADDPALARRLEEGLGGLRQALGERGFGRAEVAVQTPGAARSETARDAERDPHGSRRHPDADSTATNGRRSDTPEQRSRRRDDSNAEDR